MLQKARGLWPLRDAFPALATQFPLFPHSVEPHSAPDAHSAKQAAEENQIGKESRAAKRSRSSRLPGETADWRWLPNRVSALETSANCSRRQSIAQKNWMTVVPNRLPAGHIIRDFLVFASQKQSKTSFVHRIKVTACSNLHGSTRRPSPVCHSGNPKGRQTRS